ncbi:MAG: SUMF1/EgtB/PvdO family nonheme iron enzyme [Planctomycetia bacterium]|nr:SUMF1/EgtB/PvdO family nonheme iron enzyme [Planctomycetia bacterium]
MRNFYKKLIIALVLCIPMWGVGVFFAPACAQFDFPLEEDSEEEPLDDDFGNDFGSDSDSDDIGVEVETPESDIDATLDFDDPELLEDDENSDNEDFDDELPQLPEPSSSADTASGYPGGFFDAPSFPDFGEKAGDRAVLKIGRVEYPFRWCPAGSFMMGSRKEELGRRAAEFQHETKLSKGFWILETEATVRMFHQFVQETKYVTEAEKDGIGGYSVDINTGFISGPSVRYTWRNVGFHQSADFPVVNVSRNDASAFVAWLNEKVSTAEDVRESTRRVALPTEAQWEYACRAGTEGMFWIGDHPEDLHLIANVCDRSLVRMMQKLEGTDVLPWTLEKSDGFKFAAPVASFSPNQWGIYDVHGNVWEWCQDTFAPYDTGLAVDPLGEGDGKLGVMRGGGWNSSFLFARAATRGTNLPSRRHICIGFRPVFFSLEEDPAFVETKEDGADEQNDSAQDGETSDDDLGGFNDDLGADSGEDSGEDFNFGGTLPQDEETGEDDGEDTEFDDGFSFE